MNSDKPVPVPATNRYPETPYPEVIGLSTVEGPIGDEGVDLLNYWRALVTRRWTILAILVTSMAVTLIWTLKQTPIYQASTTIEIDRDTPDVLPFKDAYEAQTAADDTLHTEFEVLRSRTLARRVIEQLHLDNSEEFKTGEQDIVTSFMNAVKGLVPTSKPGSQESDALRPMVDSYLKRLNVSPVRLARLVTVTYESKDPELAARVLNAHAEHFIEDNFQFKLDSAQRAKAFLAGQILTRKSELEKSQDALQQYGRENGILFTGDGRNTATEKLQQLDAEHTKALADRAQKESYYRLLANASPTEFVSQIDGLPQVSTSLLIATLTTRLTQLQHDESALAVQYEPEWPARQRVRSQIDDTERALREEKQKIVKTVEAEYRAAVDKETILAKELEGQTELVNKINEDTVQYNIRKGEVDSNKLLYDGLLTKLNEADVSSTLHASNIRVVDRAEVPPNPIRPNKMINMLLSVGIGLVLGVGLALLQDHVDDSIKSTEELSRLVNLPSLGVIPKLGSLGRGGYGYHKLAYGRPIEGTSAETAPSLRTVERITQDAPLSVLSEAYRSIRTSLLLSSADHAPRTVLITSAVPSEGKTATAVNMAISLSQTGARVVLIDADMRKPRIHAILGIDNTTGLSAVLTGSCALKNVIQETAIPNLFAIPCGVTPPNPSELLLASRFRQMLEVLGQYFDYVVVDSPPINNVSDARILGSMCDRIVVVVKAFATSRHQIRRAVEHLAESRNRIAGLVLNDLDVKQGSYYSGQYYYSGRYY